MAERASPSPSPVKCGTIGSASRSRAKDLLKVAMEDDEEDDDDEETLQLKLQEIQARLKLKKLQKKNKQGSDTDSERTSDSLPRSNSVATGRPLSKLAGIREHKLERSKSQNEIHVPVSPIRKAQPAVEHRSPGRVLLGIDKGLKGSDVSLKRAPSLRRRDETGPQDRTAGPFLQRTTSQSGVRSQGAATSSQASSGEDRPQTFSERLAAIRSKETERAEREARIKKKRSTTFNIDEDQMKSFKENAMVIPVVPRAAPVFSREDVLTAASKPSRNVPRSRIVTDLQSTARNTSNTISSSLSERSDSRSSSLNVPEKKRATKPLVPLSDVPDLEATQFEPFSATHLSRRIIPHSVIVRTLSGKKPFLIPDLLRDVKAPDFSGPDVEEDVVVFGIIASKSDPKAHQGQQQKKGKFMVMTLTDLKWELDLFLFDSAFEKFWKLTPGTLIAILNPGFMPPRKGLEATGKFGLALNSDDDTILEIGSCRDLGFCKSVLKNGKTCTTWVDTRHTEFCDFHVELAVKKTQASRMEVNTMNFGKKTGSGNFGGRKFNSRDMTGHFDGKKQAAEEKITRYDVESHSQIYIGKRSTANKLDDVDFQPDAFHRGTTKEERMTRRLLVQEKERELERKLGNMGSGIGASYARARRPDPSSQPDLSSSMSEAPPPLDAASLGLLGGKAADVSLSPIKRKRTHTISSSSAVGWGSNLTKELGKMKEGENRSLAAMPPVKKKTRFVTEKGIREAGRESFGGDVLAPPSMIDFDDDDDDLDIV